MPTAAETYQLELLNRARFNPDKIAAELGIDLNEGLAPGTIPSGPRQPLAHNDILRNMSLAHTQDMLDNDFFEHHSPTTGSTEDRFIASGYEYATFAENLGGVPSNSPLDPIVVTKTMFDALFIDAGVEGRGHRKSMLDPMYKEVGIGQLEGEFQGNNFTQLMTQCFGLPLAPFRAFVGMLFEDTDANGVYTPGEEISGIDVEVWQEGLLKYSTTTDAYGYFAVIVASGTYTIIGKTAVHDVSIERTISYLNVKADLYWDEFILDPPQGTFTTTESSMITGSQYPGILALAPVNVDFEGPDRYELSWSYDNVNIIYLDGEEITAIGTKNYVALTTKEHYIIAFGPAGVTEAYLDVNVIMYPAFDSTRKYFGS